MSFLPGTYPRIKPFLRLLGLALCAGAAASAQQSATVALPDSIARLTGFISIVMLTDENDCSIVDEGYGWLLTQTAMRSFRATSACSASTSFKLRS